MRQLLPTPPAGNKGKCVSENSPEFRIWEGKVAEGIRKGSDDRVWFGGRVNKSARVTLGTYQRRVQQCGTLSYSTESPTLVSFFSILYHFEMAISMRSEKCRGAREKSMRHGMDGKPTSAANSFFTFCKPEMSRLSNPFLVPKVGLCCLVYGLDGALSETHTHAQPVATVYGWKNLS